MELLEVSPLKRMARYAPVCVMILLLAMALPYTTATHQQDDGGTGSDASDSKASPTNLGGPNRYTGQLESGPDEHDWYKFSTGEVTQTGPRQLEVFLLADWGSAVTLELFRSASESNPVATGAGSNGAKYLQWSADKSDDWVLHVAGGVTTSYTFEILVTTESDGGSGRDAPGGTTIANGLSITGPVHGKIVEGYLQPGDRGDGKGDLYRFNVGATGSLLVTLRYPTSSAGFSLSLLGSGTIDSALVTYREGIGYQTAYLRNPAPSSQWGVLVETDGNLQGGPYKLAIWNAADPTGDPGGSDAPSSFSSTAPQLSEGITQARLKRTGDQVDVFRIDDVQAGDTLFVGAGSHTPDNLGDPTADLARPYVLFELYEQTSSSTIQRGSTVAACGQAGALAWTAQDANRFYVKVREVETEPDACGDEPPVERSGNYNVFLRKVRQSDPGGGDAPASVTGNPPSVGGDAVKSGWLDQADRFDGYSMGALQPGDNARVVVASRVVSAQLRVAVFDSAGKAVGEPGYDSAGGTVGVHVSAVSSGTHRLQVHQATLVEVPYRFFVILSGDEAPAPVRLSQIDDAGTGPDDTTRTTVTLRWTESPDTDFDRYEIHAGESNSFTPSTSTQRATIGERTTTTVTVENLRPGTEYTFLVRTVDLGGKFSDSNRRQATTDSGPLTNSAPTLSDGKVEPDEGTPSTVFRFSVLYDDNDNDPPSKKLVYIDGVAYTMSTDDQVYRDGSVFILETTLRTGEHSFYFEFSDGDAEARDPSPLQGDYRGPLVAEQGGNQPPTVTASANPDEGEAPLTVQFDAVASDPNGDAISYCWDFDNRDGVTCQSSVRQPSHTYTEPALYQATVRVTDSEGATSSDGVSVNVQPPSNQPPTVSPSATPSSGQPPLTVSFRADASDPDGSISRYAWDFNNANGIQEEATTENPTHTYSQAGSFTATVTVEDNEGGRATGSVTVTVASEGNAPPSISVAAEPQTGTAPLTVSFEAHTVDPDGDPVTVTWDFDASDGIRSQAAGQTATHTYEDGGMFTVTATARDAQGAPATATVEVTVSGPTVSGPDNAVFIVATPRMGPAPLRVDFTADTDGVEAPVVSYSWDFGDGTTSTQGPEVNHTYESDGTYAVGLRVTDADGNEYESTLDVQVGGGDSPGLGFMTIIAALVGLAWYGRRRHDTAKGRQPAGDQT